MAESEPQLLGKSSEESYSDKVVIIEVGKDDLTNGQSFKFWERTLDRIKEEKAKALIFKLDTPGGLAFSTKELMSQIVELEIPTYSFIDPEAMSAGALIAISTDEIYMAPGALVGSAALVSGTGVKIEDTMRAKIESFFDAHVRWISEKKGHRYEVVEAMMMISEEDREIGPRTVKEGDLLALNSKEAIEVMEDGKPLFAVAEVKSLEEILVLKGLQDEEVVTATPTGFEKFAWWVASISAVLILVGLGGGYLEMKTPGFGIGGLISIVAFSLFFFGNYLAGNMAGYELVAVFALGLLLIAVEIFVLPGFGVAGIAGLLLVLGSLAFAMVDKVEWDGIQWESGSVVEALKGPSINLAIGIAGSLVLLYFMMRFLPGVPIFRKVLLDEALMVGTGIPDSAETQGRVGLAGVARTDLRPAGQIDLSGELVDAVAEGGFIKKGEPVQIIKEDGMGAVVTRKS